MKQHISQIITLKATYLDPTSNEYSSSKLISEVETDLIDKINPNPTQIQSNTPSNDFTPNRPVEKRK